MEDAQSVVLRLRELLHRQWEDRRPITTEELLASSGHPELDEDSLLELIYSEYCLRESAGEVVNDEAFLRRFPQLASRLQRLIEMHAALDSDTFQDAPPADPTDSAVSWVREQTAEVSTDAGSAATPTQTLREGSHKSSSHVASDDLAEADDDEGSTRFGAYQLFERLGEGGMGVVYRARHRPTNREVALKFIRSGRLAEQDASRRSSVDRFKQEAMAAARVDHDHVVTVYDAGECEDTHYYTMRLVTGKDLAQQVREHPLEGKVAARYLAGVARGVQAAHDQGILHRDIKPHNILVDAVTDRALVTDFGLAKLVRDDHRTVTGEVFGSPSYMAPEQAGNTGAIAAACDIYALGATLYHLITGRPPFQAATPLETLRQVHEQEPVPPRSLNAQIDKDLETIVLKCLQKEIDARYRSCGELADELERYLADEPIRARPISTTARVMRWSKRNRLLAATSAVAVIALVLGIVSTTAFAFRAQHNATLARMNASAWKVATKRANRLADVAEERRKVAESALHQSLVDNAGLLTEQRSAYGWSWQVLDVLEEADTIRPDDADLPRLRRLFVTAWLADDLRMIGQVAQGFDTAALAFSPDGRRLAVGERKHNLAAKVQCYDLDSLELTDERLVNTAGTGISSLVKKSFSDALRGDFAQIGSGKQRFQDGVSCLSFSGDSQWLIAGCRNGAIVAWNLDEAGTNAYRWTAFENAVHRIIVDPRKLEFYTTSADRPDRRLRAYRWEANAWSDVPLSTERIYGLARSSQHPLWLASTARGLMRFPSNPMSATSPSGPSIPVSNLNLNPTGTIAAAVSGPTIHFVDVQSGTEIRTAEIPALRDYVRSAMFDGNGERLAVTGKHAAVYFIDCSTDRYSPPLPIPGREHPIVEFSQHAALLAVAALNRVELYEMRTTPIVTRTPISSGTIDDTALTPDGRTVLTATRVRVGDQVDYQLEVWDERKQRVTTKYHCLIPATQATKPPRIDVDDQQILFVVPNVGYAFVSLDDDSPLPSDDTSPQHLLRLDHQDRHLTLDPMHVKGKTFDVDTVALSDAGNAAVAVIHPDLLVNWKPGTHKPSVTWNSQATAVLTGMSELTSLDAAGDWIVVGRRDGHSLVGHSQQIENLQLLPAGKSQVTCVQIRPPYCVVGTTGGLLTLCRLPNLDVEQSMSAFTSRVSAVGVTEDCELIIAGSDTGEICMWSRTEAGSYREALRVTVSKPIEKICLDKDGRHMLLQQRDVYSAEYWDLHALQSQLTARRLGFRAQ